MSEQQLHLMTLRALRNRVRMTQTEVAEQLGVTKETVMRWEKDSSDMPVKFMFKFADIYKYPMDEIFFGDSIAFSDNLRDNKVLEG